MDEGASKTPWSPVEHDARLRNGESEILIYKKNLFNTPDLLQCPHATAMRRALVRAWPDERECANPEQRDLSRSEGVAQIMN